MSTWALLGLVVVVVLVAVGIAGFLRWGRGREDDVASAHEILDTARELRQIPRPPLLKNQVGRPPGHARQ